MHMFSHRFFCCMPGRRVAPLYLWLDKPKLYSWALLTCQWVYMGTYEAHLFPHAYFLYDWVRFFIPLHAPAFPGRYYRDSYWYPAHPGHILHIPWNFRRPLSGPWHPDIYYLRGCWLLCPGTLSAPARPEKIYIFLFSLHTGTGGLLSYFHLLSAFNFPVCRPLTAGVCRPVILASPAHPLSL